MTREREIITVLTHCLRVLSLSQVARLWWSDTRWGRRRALQNVKACESRGLLHFQRVLARPIGALRSPLVVWHVGEGEPDWSAISKQLHRRGKLDPVMETVVFASRLAFDVFGKSRVSPIKLTQMTHDVQVSEVFFRYWLRGMPFDSWINEDRLPPDFSTGARPDALLVDSTGSWLRAIEYGGDYSVERLVALRDCAARCNVALELW